MGSAKGLTGALIALSTLSLQVWAYNHFIPQDLACKPLGTDCTGCGYGYLSCGSQACYDPGQGQTCCADECVCTFGTQCSSDGLGCVPIHTMPSMTLTSSIIVSTVTTEHPTATTTVTSSRGLSTNTQSSTIVSSPSLQSTVANSTTVGTSSAIHSGSEVTGLVTTTASTSQLTVVTGATSNSLSSLTSSIYNSYSSSGTAISQTTISPSIQPPSATSHSASITSTSSNHTTASAPATIGYTGDASQINAILQLAGSVMAVMLFFLS